MPLLNMLTILYLLLFRLTQSPAPSNNLHTVPKICSLTVLRFGRGTMLGKQTLSLSPFKYKDYDQHTYNKYAHLSLHSTTKT